MFDFKLIPSRKIKVSYYRRVTSSMARVRVDYHTDTRTPKNMGGQIADLNRYPYFLCQYAALMFSYNYMF